MLSQPRRPQTVAVGSRIRPVSGTYDLQRCISPQFSKPLPSTFFSISEKPSFPFFRPRCRGCPRVLPPHPPQAALRWLGLYPTPRTSAPQPSAATALGGGGPRIRAGRRPQATTLALHPARTQTLDCDLGDMVPGLSTPPPLTPPSPFLTPAPCSCPALWDAEHLPSSPCGALGPPATHTALSPDHSDCFYYFGCSISWFWFSLLPSLSFPDICNHFFFFFKHKESNSNSKEGFSIKPVVGQSKHMAGVYNLRVYVHFQK